VDPFLQDSSTRRTIGWSDIIEETYSFASDITAKATGTTFRLAGSSLSFRLVSADDTIVAARLPAASILVYGDAVMIANLLRTLLAESQR
jgi:hypothetical protein